MPITKSCATCGTPSNHTYCPDHRPRDTRNTRTDTGAAAWIKLSRRARTLQPFCTLCGRPDDLAADHSPRAWARTTAHLPIRLCDLTVLCRTCNNRAGTSKPGGMRYALWQALDGDLRATTPDRTLGGRGKPRPPRPSGKAKFPSHTPGGIR